MSDSMNLIVIDSDSDCDVVSSTRWYSSPISSSSSYSSTEDLECYGKGMHVGFYTLLSSSSSSSSSSIGC